MFFGSFDDCKFSLQYMFKFFSIAMLHNHKFQPEFLIIIIM